MKEGSVRWSLAETEAVAKAFAAIRYHEPAIRIPDALNRAQADAALPEGRLRLGMSKGAAYAVTIGPTFKRFAEAETKAIARQVSATLKEAAEPAPAPAPSDVQETLAVLHATVEKQGMQIAALRANRPQGLTDPDTIEALSLLTSGNLFKLALGSLIGELLDQPNVRRSLRNALLPETQPTPEAKPTAAPAIAKHDPAPFKHAREVRKSVYVVGLKPNQATETLKRHGATFSLRFDDSSTSHHLMRDRAKGADITICMVGWVDHATSAQLRRHANDYRMCNGTVSDLDRVLTAIAGEP